MTKEQIASLLTTLTGQLQTSTPHEEKEVLKLQRSIADALILQNPSDIRNPEFLFERSDLAGPAIGATANIKKINDIAKRVLLKKEPAALNVFVREVPIRSTQISGSSTLASAGTRAKTIGPLYDIHGTPHWYDFVKVKKLIALYVQGETMPSILFDATFNQPKYFPVNSKPVELTKTFTIDPESVWIKGKLLESTIPEDQYCGLRVKGGTITLELDPFMNGGNLTIPANCNVDCSLDLAQNNSYPSDPASPYGADARNAKYALPDSFRFSFKNSVKKINAVGNSKWKVYGQTNSFKYSGNQNCIYNPFINRVAVSINCSQPTFQVQDCKSPFFQVDGSAKIVSSWWALPLTKLNMASPLEADGNGAIIIECSRGLDAKWTSLKNKAIAFVNPFIMGEPGRICITDLLSDGAGAFQQFDGWKDERNPFGTTLVCKYTKNSPLIFNTVAMGDEVIFSLNDWDIQTDRPVKVNGEAVAVRTKNSASIIAISKLKTFLFVVDENILWDNKLPSDKIPHVKPYALAMHNALLTVTPPNSLVLFAESTPELRSLIKGQMYLGFGLFSYLPTLPDPYAANLGILKGQFNSSRESLAKGGKRGSQVWLWLIALVKWKPLTPELDKVGVSFHFAPLSAPLQIEQQLFPNQVSPSINGVESSPAAQDIFSHFNVNAPSDPAASSKLSVRMQAVNNNPLSNFNLTDFSLLDVSSKANQMGVSYAKQNNTLQVTLARKYKVDIQDETSATIFPIQIRGLDAITAGMNAQAFTVPSIAWEPVFNLTKPDVAGDPPVGFNYYPNDGMATRIGNLSKNSVPLSPIPMAKFLVETYKTKEDGKTFALFNLPFGMLALAVLNNKSKQQIIPDIQNTKPLFENYIHGGIQLELTAGTSFSQDDDPMFEGYTIQLINVNNADGSPSFSSTLAKTPTEIFNHEFLQNISSLKGRPGVPVTKTGLSGYGASMFSNWQNKEAIAQTSQAVFNVITGRTSREVVQVKSFLYPYGIRVVRTITIFRMANGYVARIDSGWQAETDGKFDFSLKTPNNRYTFHPGIVRGLFNVRNIHEVQKDYFTHGTAQLAAVTFDADVEFENVTEGGENNRVPTKGATGFVQLLPQGDLIKESDFVALLKSENNSIGGPVNCVLKIANTPQRMKLNRFDVSTAVDDFNKPIFVCAGRGSAIMPKDGSWTMVQHNRGTGDVSPLPEQLSVPLIRVGKWVKGSVIDAVDVANNLIRVAHPAELLKAPDVNTINFGFLQNMGTQKVLFMTPGFKLNGKTLLSKTPPLLADSFRLLNSKGIFPNIGNIETDFGQAISLLKGLDINNNPVTEAFKSLTLPDGSQVFNLLELHATEEVGKLLDQGYTLAKTALNGLADRALKFDLPHFDYPLINLSGKLIINIQYKASSTPKGKPTSNYEGKFDYDVDSFTNKLEDTWKGRLNNLAMVVTIGPLTDVMTIKGNFNSQKAKDVDLGSSNSSDSPGLNLPTPEIEFSDALKPVIKILEILASLSSGDYGDALKKGLKIAMSNSANVWEYKFEANKDIPLVKFPPGELYDSPQVPLKLEASLGIGVFFNAALKVTTDPKQLLPTVGGYFKFHGGLQVMCVSVGAGTIYAVGNVDLKLEADSSPKVAVTMKFGFGAQITVGLPVVGHVSILFMVGIEIYADSSSVVKITAILLFKGQAELLGGLVSITITIEAKGSVEKIPGKPTNCIAQVTFGIDISIFLIIDISFSESWEETRQIA